MSEESPTTEVPAKKPSRVVVILAVVVAAIAGLGSGVVGIGPMLAKPANAEAADSTQENVDGDAEQHDAGGDTASTNGAPLVLNNVVMNPAGSRGTRFLLVSVGFEFAPALPSEQFANLETEIRDAVIGALGSKTVDDLVDYTRRDAYRSEIAAAVEKLVPDTKVRRVFFPQFVIQ